MTTLGGSGPRPRSRAAGRSRTATTTNVRPEGYAGQAYLALIQDLLAEETRTRESLERRAVGVLATIAVIVTVIASLAGGRALETVEPPGPLATLFGTWSGMVLVFAGVFAWLTILPRAFDVAGRESLRRITRSLAFWAADPRIGTRHSADTMLDSLVSVRDANSLKAWDLVASMGLGLIGVALLLAAAVAVALGA